MEKKRNIQISFDEAMELYNSNNKTLRELVLTAYTKDELKLDFNYVRSKVYKNRFNVIIPANEIDKLKVLADLAIIAKYFNGSWRKTAYNTGYFIGSYTMSGDPIDVACSTVVKVYDGKGISIYKSNTAQYAGVVYFRNQEDALKAIKILGDRIKDVF